MNGRAPRVLFYSHNGVGVGHFRRQLRLATAFRERRPDAEVLQVTGSPQWYTVVGGSRAYVELLAARLPDVRRSAGVTDITVVERGDRLGGLAGSFEIEDLSSELRAADRHT